MVIDMALSTDSNYVLSNSIYQSTMEFRISQSDTMLLDIEKKYLQTNAGIELIVNAIKRMQIESLKKSIQSSFDDIRAIESVIELESDDNKVSLILNTSLPDNLSPDEIGKINDKAFEILSMGNYSFIDSVMVL